MAAQLHCISSLTLTFPSCVSRIVIKCERNGITLLVGGAVAQQRADVAAARGATSPGVGGKRC